ncbi:MAG: ABC transporter ATP-binding protein [Chloroflexi bacterium]|nr:ABC transporter ATP-binding protein [Chloroflexota bacterium]
MPTSINTSDHLLDVRGLETQFDTESGALRAVDDVSLYIDEGETLGLVGESGCGKSVTALSIMRLIQSPPGKIVGGQIWYQGTDLLAISEQDMRRIRGSSIGMIFQEPMTSLNPVLTIGRQLTETLELHLKMTKSQANTRAAELLEMVGLPDAEDRLRTHPHQLSGGQRQRVMIAIALSCNPKLLIADEPTTALDVTIQAQILELLKSLASELGTSLLIITHNLGVVARYANRVNVMYAGKIRESASSIDLYATPRHPYTVGLLRSVPRLDIGTTDRLIPIDGEIPDGTNLPSGCAFRNRCQWAVERCADESPSFETVSDGHTSACYEWQRVRSESEATVT